MPGIGVRHTVHRASRLRRCSALQHFRPATCGVFDRNEPARLRAEFFQTAKQKRHIVHTCCSCWCENCQQRPDPNSGCQYCARRVLGCHISCNKICDAIPAQALLFAKQQPLNFCRACPISSFWQTPEHTRTGWFNHPKHTAMRMLQTYTSNISATLQGCTGR